VFFCGLGHINALRASEAVQTTDVMVNTYTFLPVWICYFVEALNDPEG